MARWSGKLENLAEAFGRLSRREKIMVGGMGACLLLFIGALVSLWISSRLSALERKIADTGQKLQQMISLRDDYERAKAVRQRSEQRIRAARSIQLMGTLEGLAQSLGIDTKKMEMKPLPPVTNAESDIEEQRVDVRVPAIAIDRLTSLLEQIEQRSDSIAVRSLAIKKNFQDPTRLDANFTVSKFQLKEQKEPPPAAAGGKKT